MTKQVEALTYTSLSSSNQRHYVAQLLMQGSQDLTWQVQVTRNDQTLDRAIVPRWLLIDNASNDQPVTINYGSIQFSVRAFTRNNLVLPDEINQVIFGLGSTTQNVVATFSEQKYVDDQADQYLIQKALGSIVNFNTVVYASTVNQDINKNLNYVLFSSPGLATYNLLNTLGVTVQNGFAQFIRNLGQTNITITPAPGTAIDAYYGAGNPLILEPGEKILIVCDGLNWWTFGDYSVKTAEISLSTVFGTGVTTIAHGLPKQPRNFRVFLKCTTSEGGYGIGEIIEVTQTPWVNNLVQFGGVTFEIDDTNINMIKNAAWLPGFVNKTTSLVAFPTAARWSLFIRSWR
jgi:hypothetical protein